MRAVLRFPNKPTHVVFLATCWWLLIAFTQESGAPGNADSDFRFEARQAAQMNAIWNPDSGEDPKLNYSEAFKIAKEAAFKRVKLEHQSLVVSKIELKFFSLPDVDLPIGSKVWYWEFVFVAQPFEGNAIRELSKKVLRVVVFFDKTVAVNNVGR